jgi:hypothetical protein
MGRCTSEKARTIRRSNCAIRGGAGWGRKSGLRLNSSLTITSCLLYEAPESLTKLHSGGTRECA